MNARSQAARRSCEVFAERAARIAAREAAIEAVLVDYFVATGTAEQTLMTARRRCEQIMTQARAAARDCDTRAGAAVTGLRDLGVSRAEIAQITGLSERRIRGPRAAEAVARGSAAAAIEQTATEPCGAQRGGRRTGRHAVCAVSRRSCGPG